MDRLDRERRTDALAEPLPPPTLSDIALCVGIILAEILAFVYVVHSYAHIV
jgi:hypothetical protein